LLLASFAAAKNGQIELTPGLEEQAQLSPAVLALEDGTVFEGRHDSQPKYVHGHDQKDGEKRRLTQFSMMTRRAHAIPLNKGFGFVVEASKRY